MDGTKSLLLTGVHVNPAAASSYAASLPFLSQGRVSVRLRSRLTYLVGENGCGKTTLLEAIAARCAIRPGGGGTYAEYEERDGTPLSRAVTLDFVGHRPQGLFFRADKLAEAVARAPVLPMAGSGEWRRADEQSRGEGVLTLLAAQVDESERKLYLLDEPETGLSPQRQMELLCLLDNVLRGGRSQALVATHAPILLAHPEADILWVDREGIERRALADVAHWRVMNRFMRDTEGTLRRLLGDED